MLQRRDVRLAAVLGLWPFVLAACSSATSSPDPRTQSSLVRVGRVEAPVEGERSFTGIVAAAKRIYGAALPIRTFEVGIGESEGTAFVTYRYDIPALDQEGEVWVREGNAWKLDECG